MTSSMNRNSYREEGWSEIPGDIIDPTSPKPQNPRSSNLNTNNSNYNINGSNGAVLLPQLGTGSATNIIGDSNNNR